MADLPGLRERSPTPTSSKNRPKSPFRPSPNEATMTNFLSQPSLLLGRNPLLHPSSKDLTHHEDLLRLLTTHSGRDIVALVREVDDINALTPAQVHHLTRPTLDEVAQSRGWDRNVLERMWRDAKEDRELERVEPGITAEQHREFYRLLGEQEEGAIEESTRPRELACAERSGLGPDSDLTTEEGEEERDETQEKRHAQGHAYDDAVAFERRTSWEKTAGNSVDLCAKRAGRVPLSEEERAVLILLHLRDESMEVLRVQEDNNLRA